MTGQAIDPRLAGLGAVLLWASLGTLAASVTQVPALQTLAIAFAVGGVLSWLHRPPVGWRPLFILGGCAGLFGSHLLYFAAMSLAPAAQVVVINYTWPLMMVFAAPLFRLPGSRWSVRIVAAALLGFGAVAMLAWNSRDLNPRVLWGWSAALGSAAIWCGFCIAQARHRAFGDYPLGPGMLLTGALSGSLLLAFDGWVPLTPVQGLTLLLIGAGPMGAAFVLWALALQRGDAQWLGVVANISPVLSVALLTALGIAEPSARLLWAAIALAVAGLLVGSRAASCQRSVSVPAATGRDHV